MRIVRSGAASIHLEEQGFGVESAPLTRSAFEHALRLLWAQEHGADFIEVIKLQRAGGIDKIIKAQEFSWEFNPQVAGLLEERMADANDDYKHLSNLTALRHIVDENPDQRGALYMGWLLDTQESHPSIDTAQPYYEMVGPGLMRLRDTPKSKSNVVVKICIALIAGLQGYVGISGTEYDVEPHITRAIKELHKAYPLRNE